MKTNSQLSSNNAYSKVKNYLSICPNINVIEICTNYYRVTYCFIRKAYIYDGALKSITHVAVKNRDLFQPFGVNKIIE